MTADAIKDINSFYQECVDSFHEVAKKNNVATKGVIFIPELIPLGEQVILEFLKDPFLQQEFAEDPRSFYYAVMSFSIQAGIVLAEQWRRDRSHISDCVMEIIENGPSDKAIRFLTFGFPREIYQNQGNDFFQKVFEVWAKLHEPYWRLSDPRQYTFKALLAAYQLGVSMILGLFGYEGIRLNDFNSFNQKADEAEKARVEEQKRIKQENEERKRRELDEQATYSTAAAIIKRAEITERAIKKRKTIKIILVVIICVVLAALAGRAIWKDAYNSQLRNFATETMNEDYSNVYADVVSIEPVYFVYEYKTNKSGNKIGKESINGIVCKCITVEGETIWAEIFYLNYPGGGLMKGESAYKSLRYSKSNPARITGDVDTARQILPELEKKIGNVYVLDVNLNCSIPSK